MPQGEVFENQLVPGLLGRSERPDEQGENEHEGVHESPPPMMAGGLWCQRSAIASEPVHRPDPPKGIPRRKSALAPSARFLRSTG